MFANIQLVALREERLRLEMFENVEAEALREERLRVETD